MKHVKEAGYYVAFGLILFGAGFLGLLIGGCAPVSITDPVTGGWRVPWWIVFIVIGSFVAAAWRSR